MIDNITICIDEKMTLKLPDDNRVFEYRGLNFIPRFSSSGEIFQWDATLKNLRIKIRPSSNQVIICNSLHKYAHGSNYTDYSLTELRDTIEELSDILNINMFHGDIKKIEYGCNILVPDANLPWQRLISYKNKFYQQQLYKGQPYGASSYSTNYVLKAYNKAKQVKAVDGLVIPDNLFRWEVKAASMAALHKRKVPIPVEKVEHLLNVQNAQSLADDAVKKYRDSIKNCLPNFDLRSLREMTAYARMSDKKVSDFIQLNHTDTYNMDRKLFREVMNDAAATEDNVGELMEQKFKELIYS